MQSERPVHALQSSFYSKCACPVQSDGDEGVLVDLAVKTIEMLANVKTPSDKGAAEGDVGAGLSCGELPMAQATVLCILRVGVVERLGEIGQVRYCSVCMLNLTLSGSAGQIADMYATFSCSNAYKSAYRRHDAPFRGKGSQRCFIWLQRRLLERLVALAASVIGSQVPLAAVTLETLGLLLEVLGEVLSLSS